MATRSVRRRLRHFNYNPNAARHFLGNLRTACRALVPHTNYEMLTCEFFTTRHHVSVEIDRVERTSSVQITELEDFCPLKWTFTLSDQGANLNFVTEFIEEMQRPLARIPIGSYAFRQPGIFDVVRNSDDIPHQPDQIEHFNVLAAKVERSFRPLSGFQVIAHVSHGPPNQDEPPSPLTLPAW